MPFSPRGQHGIKFKLSETSLAREELAEIPGVQLVGSVGGKATHDAAKILGIVDTFAEPVDECSGMQTHFKNKLRPYQVEAANFLAKRHWALCILPPRAGKTPTALGAASLVGGQKILIVCPATLKRQWAQEVKAWLDIDALILGGRAGEDAYFLPELGARRKWLGDEELNGALLYAKCVVINYELLMQHVMSDATGKIHKREDLPGWADSLARHGFDVAIIDECQMISGAKSNEGNTRRECVARAIANVKHAWGLSGTPIDSSPAQLWSSIDALSNGAASGGRKRTPFKWQVRYAGAGHDYVDTLAGPREVWKIGLNGKVTHAQELKARLSVCAVVKSRVEILPDLPPKTRSVYYVQKSTQSDSKLGTKPSESKLTKLRSHTLTQKIPVIVDRVKEELEAGEKSIIFVHYRDAVDRFAKAFAKVDIPGRIFTANGDQSPEARAIIAENFRLHSGPAAIIATIDSLSTGIRLDPASSVHFAELSFRPTTVMQAEDRPYLPGVTRGLTVTYYVLSDSVDQHIVKLLVPKIEALEKTLGDRASEGLNEALAGPPVSLDALWASMTVNIDLANFEDEDED